MEDKNKNLMSAVMSGDIEAAITAIESGEDIHQKTSNGHNLLYVALNRSQLEMFEWLLEIEKSGEKIEINNVDISGQTLLYSCIGNIEFLPYFSALLKAGANPNICTKDGMSPLIKAVSLRQIEYVSELLNYNADINYTIKDSKTNAFLMGTLEGTLEICKLLLEKGADINSISKEGDNALINAIGRKDQFLKKKDKQKQIELCMFLIESGININYESPNGLTALWLAGLIGKINIVKTLLEKGANANVKGNVGMGNDFDEKYLIHFLSFGKDPELIDLAIKNGANIMSTDLLGNAAFFNGLANPLLKEKFLELSQDIDFSNSNVKIKEEENIVTIPLLTLMMKNNNTDLIENLISRGTPVSFFENEDVKVEHNPIIVAISSSASKTVELLLRNKSIDLNHLIKLKNNNEKLSLLMLLASDALNGKIAEFLRTKNKIEKILKGKEINDKNGVKSKLIDEEGIEQLKEDLKSINDLIKLVNVEKEKIFESLIKNGADINLLNEQNKNAMFYARNEIFAKLLIKNGIDIYQKDDNGNNPLIDSVINNKADIIDILKPLYKKANNETIDSIFYQLAFTDSKQHSSQIKLEGGLYQYLKTENINEEDLAKVFSDEDITLNIENINYQDEDGNTPVLIACANDLPSLVAKYIKLGSDINLKNNNGETPIMHAISSKNEQLVEFLIEKGANCQDVTLGGKSVLDFAEELKNTTIIEKVKIGLGYKIKEGSISGSKKF